MQTTLTKKFHQKLTCDRLPLAVYREVVAHLRQVCGLNAGLFEQTATEFDYLQSQVGGLWLEYDSSLIDEDKMKSILAYYEQKYGSWLTICIEENN